MIGSRRGQTTLDFAVGMSVFLLTVVFVVSYAPTLFDPFAGGTGTKLVVADRVATTLSGDLLVGSTAEPGILSAVCVAEFFGESIDGATCSTNADFDDFDGTLSLDDRNADVTVHELGDPISSPASPGWADGANLTRSNSASIPSDVAVATRTVSIENEQYRLTVRVW
jgi:hypothetical protein